MTHFHLRIGNIAFSVGSTLLCAIAGALVAAAILLAYIDTLHESVRRGEAFRQSQRSGVTDSASRKPDIPRRIDKAGVYALVSK